MPLGMSPTIPKFPAALPHLLFNLGIWGSMSVTIYFISNSCLKTLLLMPNGLALSCLVLSERHTGPPAASASSSAAVLCGGVFWALVELGLCSCFCKIIVAVHEQQAAIALLYREAR